MKETNCGMLHAKKIFDVVHNRHVYATAGNDLVVNSGCHGKIVNLIKLLYRWKERKFQIDLVLYVNVYHFCYLFFYDLYILKTLNVNVLFLDEIFTICDSNCTQKENCCCLYIRIFSSILQPTGKNKFLIHCISNNKIIMPVHFLVFHHIKTV